MKRGRSCVLHPDVEGIFSSFFELGIFFLNPYLQVAPDNLFPRQGFKTLTCSIPKVSKP